MPRPDPERRADARRELARRELARRHLLEFTEFTFAGYQANWHHQVIADALDRVAQGQCRRLMVFTHPRAGKSELVSRRFPAWLLGRNPNAHVTLACYSAGLAERMGRDVQRVMSSPEYARLFPGTKLAKPGDGKRTAREFEVAGRQGSYYSVGVLGGLTGRGFDVAVIDDPVKDRLEAESETYRERVWEWYTSVLHTRRDRPAHGAIVLCMTRWHEDDLAGRLLGRAATGEGEQWTVLWLPAVREADNPYPVAIEPVDPRHVGHPLWPERFSVPELDSIARQSSRDWTSMWQQRPAPAEGGMFKRHWLRHWGKRVTERGQLVCEIPGHPDMPALSMVRWLTVDLAVSLKTSADYTVIQCWGLCLGGELVLLDQHRERLEGPDQLPAIKRMAARYAVSAVWIERSGYQLALVQHAAREGLPVRELLPDRDKRARALPLSSLMEQGKVFLPQAAVWLGDFEAELLTFPAGAHDDQVDAAAYAALVALDHGMAPPLPPKVTGPGPSRDSPLALDMPGQSKQVNRVLDPW